MLYGRAAGLDGSRYYDTSYEVEPLEITLIVRLIGTDLRVYYRHGEDAHFIGN